MHRHFTYLREDETYKYYYHPFPYKETVDKVAKKFNINPIIILSIMEVESIFNSNAYSSAGAIGLMQIMPATGRAIAKELGIKDYDLYLPKYNIEFGGYYLSELLKRFHFQLPFSAASYNGGPHNMKRWLDDNKSKDLKLDEMIEEIGFRESRNYAKKIIKLFSIYNKTYFNEEQNIPVNVKYTDNKKIDF
jgi:soluble lytic murein transglycosylase